MKLRPTSAIDALVIILFLFSLGLVPCAAESKAHIVIMAVEDPSNYDAVNSMKAFAEKELRPLGHRVTLVEGNQPKPTDFPGLIEAMKEADLLILFARRCTLPHDQLAAIRDHLDAGKPLLAIRTANHAFLPVASEPITDAALGVWPEFTPEVLGGQNTGYETKGLPYRVAEHPAAPADSPRLEGVDAESLQGFISLYKVLPLAADTTPLLIGTATETQTPPQPLAWTRLHGEKKARIFYTSLGAPEDMPQPSLRQLLLNAVAWTLGQP